MKILVKTKLLDLRHIEIRDYELGKDILKVILCASSDYKTHDHINEPYQIYTLSDQKKGRITNTQQSKFYPYPYYKMLKFLWKPKDVIREQGAVSTFNAMNKLAKTDEWEKLRKILHS